METKKKMNMIAYYHAFEMIFNSLSKVGFVVEGLLELRAPKRVKK